MALTSRLKKFWNNYISLTELFVLPMKNSKISTLLNTVLFPSIMIVFFRRIYGELAMDRIQFILTGSLIIGAISTSLSTLSSKINNIVTSDGMEFFLGFPISKFEFILALITAELIIYLPSSIIVLAFGKAYLGIYSNTNYIMLIIFLILLSLSLVGIGAIIGYKSKNFNQNLTISSLVSYGIVFLSPIYYPIDSLHVVLRSLSYFFPSTYAANVIRGLILDSSSIPNKEILINLSVLMLFCLLSFYILSRVFKWFLE